MTTGEVRINDRWLLQVPDHRVSRPGWDHWERDTLAALWFLIRPGDVVWDIGAEEGDLSALYASWGARVVCVEPSPFAWPWIKETFVANGLTAESCHVTFAGPATTFPYAPDFDGTPDQDGWPASASDPMFADPDHGFRCLREQTDTTPSVRLDDLAAPAPDLVCIDIEGAEYQMLLGAQRILNEVRPTWMISVHPEFMRDTFGDTPDDLYVLFELAGYEHHYVGFDHEYHHCWKPQ